MAALIVAMLLSASPWSLACRLSRLVAIHKPLGALILVLVAVG
jgi:hypothetical protein